MFKKGRPATETAEPTLFFLLDPRPVFCLGSKARPEPFSAELLVSHDPAFRGSVPLSRPSAYLFGSFPKLQVAKSYPFWHLGQAVGLAIPEVARQRGGARVAMGLAFRLARSKPNLRAPEVLFKPPIRGYELQMV